MANHSHYEHQFQQLMELQECGDGDGLFAELLRHGPSIFEPLSDYILRDPDNPRCAILVDLLSKCLDDRCIRVLMSLLESREAEIRRAAANGLGWNRARVGLEALDTLEGNDPDERVRQEARTAIDEILKDFPKLAELLRHHRTGREAGRDISGDHDEVPRQGHDPEQTLKLMATLPRLLAVKYKTVPLHFSPNDQLHLAVRNGSERRLIATMSELTGHGVELHGWPEDKIELAIEQLYKLGDDDFCAFHNSLTPLARDEVVEVIIAGVRPNEPGCPLSEVNDAVEAAQVFLSCCGLLRVWEAKVEFRPPEMTITAKNKDGLPVVLEAPQPVHRERFISALRILANLDPGAGLAKQDGGKIRCTHCDPKYTAHVSSEKNFEGETVKMRFEEEQN